MSDPFVAEIRIFAGNFAPKNWATCDGQLFPVSQNAVLFSLLGTTFGGDGRSAFALPNMAGSAPVAAGNGAGLTPRAVGESGGYTSITLLTADIPIHSHALQATNQPGRDRTPQSEVLARSTGMNLYTPSGTQVRMAPQATSSAGSSLAHNNLQPYLALTFIIALAGIYPSRGA
jgi:microcystin-dependent protein